MASALFMATVCRVPDLTLSVEAAENMLSHTLREFDREWGRTMSLGECRCRGAYMINIMMAYRRMLRQLTINIAGRYR